MTTRHAIYASESDKFDHKYSLSDKKYEPIPKLDLFNEEAVWELQQLYTDLAKYPIDGVLIQDDFVIRHMEGYGTEAKVQYLKKYNKLLDAKKMFSEVELKPDGRVKRIEYTEKFWQFQEWKNKRLKLVADDLITTVKENNPKAVVALNVSYEMFYKPKNALAWYAHNTSLATKFDYAAVMAYQDQIMKELNIGLNEAGALIEANTQNAINIMGSPNRVIMKIQTLNWDTRKNLPMREVRYVFQKVESSSKEVGIALVPWGNRKFNFIKAIN